MTDNYLIYKRVFSYTAEDYEMWFAVKGLEEGDVGAFILLTSSGIYRCTDNTGDKQADCPGF